MSFLQFKLNYLYFLLIFFSSCKEVKEACSIEGKWYFHQVNRNYKPTNTLEGGYFEFKSGNVFSSNIFDENVEYSYTFNNVKIEINTDERLNFTLVKCSSDTLILAGEISAFYMNFLMTKSPIEDEDKEPESTEDELQ